MKRIDHYSKSLNPLHIEVPGAVINIWVGLEDTEGHEVTTIEIKADGDRFAGEDPWYLADLDNVVHLSVRVVRYHKEEA